MGNKMTRYALDGPSAQILVNVSANVTRLQTKGISAEIYASWIRRIFLYSDG